jgi:hypothetical protein
MIAAMPLPPRLVRLSRLSRLGRLGRLGRAIAPAFALCAAAAAAQPVLPPAAGASGAAGGAPADRLHACIADNAALAERKRALDARAAEHERRFAQVQAEAPALLRAKLDLDAGDAALGADEFNARVARHDAEVTALNAQAADIQAAQDAWQADAAAIRRRCAGVAADRGRLGVAAPARAR